MSTPYRGAGPFRSGHIGAGHPLSNADVPDSEWDKPAGFSAAIIDRTNEDRMWIAGTQGVYISTNKGQSWAQIVRADGVDSIAVSIERNLLFVTARDETRVWTLDGR